MYLPTLPSSAGETPHPRRRRPRRPRRRALAIALRRHRRVWLN